MIRLLLFAFLCSVSLVSWSQCIRGDCFNGQGTYSWPNGQKYVGQWKDGKQNGQGTETLASGKKYVGQSKYNRTTDLGTHT